MTSKLVSWPEPPELWAPEDDTGEVVLERETEGECRTKRVPLVPPTPPPVALPPGCDADERLASEEDKRGLPADVTGRDRLPLPSCPVARPGEASELVEEVDDWRLVT